MKKARSEMKHNALYERLRKEMYLAIRKDLEQLTMIGKTLNTDR